jgi:hypothetical protein
LTPTTGGYGGDEVLEIDPFLKKRRMASEVFRASYDLFELAGLFFIDRQLFKFIN